MDRVYIIDAVNYLFRSYYAIGPMLGVNGQSVSALFGFIRTVQKLMRDFSPGHLVCVFDGPDNKKMRQEVYADYKATRKGAPEDLFPQFELAMRYCNLAQIPTLCIHGVEADDTMATVALWAKSKGAKSFICSSDKDLMQLVDDDIYLLQLHKDNLLVDAKKVEEFFGVKPNQILDLLSIMGDTSDNIPGLPGFGPKTAAALLNEFGTLDHLLANPQKVKGEKKQQILTEHKDLALLSRQLATLHTNIEIPKDEKAYALGTKDVEGLLLFFQEMKFNSLIKELLSPSEAKKEEPKALELSPKDYRIIDTESELKELFTSLKHEKEICVDTKTTDLHPMLANLVGVGFSVQENTGFYIPLNGKLGKKHVLKELKEFFETTESAFYGHNLKYDDHILANHQIPVKKIAFDTLLASYVLDPQNKKHSLDALTLENFKHVKITTESLIGKGKQQISMRDVPIEKVSASCCEDVDYTLRLKKLFEGELKKKNLSELFFEIELPLVSILADMERAGISLDVLELRQIGLELNKQIEELKGKIFQEAGEEFNLNSPKQLSHVLFEKMKLPSKGSSTSADILEELAPAYPIAALVLEYRTYEKLRSTYVETLPDAIHPVTGKIHCTFNQSVAATGRLSCQDPNLQNIPLHSKLRACFKPAPQHSYLSADYSQIELRLLAHFCMDEKLIEAFQSGRDIHRHTASIVFGVPEEEVSSSMRSAAKTVNFGILYGQGAYGLSRQLGIPMKEASEFIKTYFNRYPKVGAYLEQCKEFARKKGYSQTLMGRTRKIPEMHNQNPMIRTAAERLAVNTPLQGTAADLIKIAMIHIDQALKEKGLFAKMILQIHDELIFEVPDGEIEPLRALVKEKMETVFSLKVPLLVETSVGKNWAEC